MNNKKVKIALTIVVIVALISALIIAFYYKTDIFPQKKVVTQTLGSYSSEVKTIEWFSNTSDLIISGVVERKTAPAVGNNPSNNSNLVYTDTIFKITKIFKNVTEKNFITETARLTRCFHYTKYTLYRLKIYKCDQLPYNSVYSFFEQVNTQSSGIPEAHF